MSNNPRYANHRQRVSVQGMLRMECRPCWICDFAIDYSAHYLHPHAFEVDEYEPISRGGSPTDYANLGAAHRCCNGWRSNRSVGEVLVTKKLIMERFGGWTSPEDFVAKAKALKGKRLPVAKPKVTTTTEW